ncbi:MAG: hypothetical protein ACJARD_001246 [Alphaproteobacteria bacterium]|jgi:hypothetical protein
MSDAIAQDNQNECVLLAQDCFKKGLVSGTALAIPLWGLIFLGIYYCF